MKKQQQLLWLTIAIISTAMMSGNKTAYAQKIPLHGVVSIQNSGFNNKGVIEYVNLAQVEDDFDSANPDATDSEGKFTLNYIGVAQNDAVSFSVKKAGLKVVNIDRLNVTLGKNEATQIYMCEPEVLAENKKRYYKIGKTAGEKQLKIKLQQAKEELALLERAVDVNVIQIQDKNEQIRFLEQQGQNLDKHAKELAKRFAHENFDEASALSQKAFRLFQEGKIYEALDVLDIKRLDADLKKADEAIAKGEDLIRAGTKMKATGEKGKQLIVKDCMLGAEMAQAVFEFEKAEAYFEKAIQADSTNLSNLWKYAFYLAKQNKFNKAEQLYEKCLDLAKTPYERATFLNNLGALLATKNELEKAEQAYEEALSIYRKLAAKNPDAYLFYVATPLNNLGALLADKNELEKAEQAYEEALSIYRKLAEKNPAAYLPYVATSLNNLGALLADKNELEKAEQAYEEALSIRRKLAEKNPDAYLPYVATSLNNLGILYQAKNELEKAEQAYEETLSIYRKLAEKNPDAYLPDVSMTLNNLANLQSDKNELEKAEQAYEEALSIRRKLAKKNPDAYLLNVANSLNGLANLQKAKNELAKAGKSYEEALNISRKLAEKNPDAYLPNVAGTLNNLGILYKSKNELQAAEKSYEEALSIRRTLAEKNPDAYLPDVAGTLNNLGILYKSKNELQAAEKSYKEALSIRRTLAEKNPDAYLPDVSMTLNNLGNLYKSKNELQAAEKSYKEALSIRRTLAEKNPDAYLPDVSMTLNNLGSMYLTTAPDTALVYLEEALQIREKLANKNPRVYGIDYANTVSKIGIVYAQKYVNIQDETYLNKGITEIDKALPILADFPNVPRAVKLTETLLGLKNALLQLKEKTTQQTQDLPAEVEQAILGGLQALGSELNQADSLFKTKDYKTALTHQNTALEGLHILDSLAQNNIQVAEYLTENYKVKPIALREMYSQNHSQTSWYALFAQEYKLAEQHAQKGLRLDATQEWIKTNLAHALLFQGKYAAAESIYLELKNSSYKLSEEKTNVEVLLQDLKDLEAGGAVPKAYRKDVGKIKALLGK